MNSPEARAAAVLSDVRSTDWQAWAIPLPGRLFAYEAGRVIPAFESLVRASTPRQGQDAYNEMLDAIGHNHSGTPSAAMAPATRLLARLVPHLGAGGPAGMDVVTDCVLWSAGEQHFVDADGIEHNLGLETLAAANTLGAVARRWVGGGDALRHRAATGLLEALADHGGGLNAAKEMSPLLSDLKHRLDALLTHVELLETALTKEQAHALEEAARNFKLSGPQLLADATPYLWQYYLATVAEFTPEQCVEYGIPQLPESTDIWSQVSITLAPSLELGRPPLSPASAYVSFEGEVSWEPEHGLRLVIEEGLHVCKVGPYDGHLTNAQAFGDASLVGVIYR